MKKTLSDTSIVYAKIRNDIRIQELEKTRKVRELNALERLMVKQIVNEYMKELN